MIEYHRTRDDGLYLAWTLDETINTSNAQYQGWWLFSNDYRMSFQQCDFQAIPNTGFMQVFGRVGSITNVLIDKDGRVQTTDTLSLANQIILEAMVRRATRMRRKLRRKLRPQKYSKVRRLVVQP